MVPVVLHQMCSQLPGLSHLAIVLLTELLETFGDSLAPYCQVNKSVAVASTNIPLLFV